MKEGVAEYEAAVTQAADEGWLLFSIGKPRERLYVYKECTYPEDMMLVLTPDYPKLLRAGIMPPLRCIAEWNNAVAPVTDEKGQVTVPIPSDLRPFMWALLLLCPDFVFLRWATDFRKLAAAEMERLGGDILSINWDEALSDVGS